ncbi:MAG: hypothetical protein IJM59_04465 [Proteobacteria bacterium]|nr:hypothetical protein [Pseudomonadota bacterium]
MSEKDETKQEPMQDPQTEERVNALARHYRHIGFAIFGGLAAIISMFLLYTVLTALDKGEVYDPVSGVKVAQP